MCYNKGLYCTRKADALNDQISKGAPLPSRHPLAGHHLLSLRTDGGADGAAHKGVLRGIHFQNAPMAQAKLVRVTKGAVLDVAVDLRKGSPTYCQWVSVELSAENKRMFYIPRGFGHGFVTLTDNVEFCYKVDNLYSRECDRGIRFNDPDIGVAWGIEAPILSQKDTTSPLLSESDCNFVYGEV